MQTFWSLLLVAAVVIAVFFIVKNQRSAAQVADGAPMPLGKRLFLTFYLLAVGTGLAFMLVSLNSLEFPQTAVITAPAVIVLPTPTPVPNATEPPAAPVATA